MLVLHVLSLADLNEHFLNIFQLNYLMTVNGMKILPTTFLAVDILYVASAREFYVIEVYILRALYF